MRALVATCSYRSVWNDSSKLVSAGLTHAIMSVAELPPREFMSSWVSLESRYGTCRSRSANAMMHLPRVLKDWSAVERAQRSAQTHDVSTSAIGTHCAPVKLMECEIYVYEKQQE